MKIFPQLTDHYHLPTVYDSVIINEGTPLMQSGGDEYEPFRVELKPQSTTIDFSKRATNIEAILQRTHILTASFINETLKNDHSLQKKLDLALDLKDILQNNESVLDYLAHYLALWCLPPPNIRKIAFPIAGRLTTEEDFEKTMRKDFPKLADNAPLAFDYILQIQHFRGEYTLIELNELVNRLKHRDLTDFEIITHKSVVFTCNETGFRLGEMGFNKIELGANASLEIRSSKLTAVIKGPCLITKDDYSSVIGTQNLKIEEQDLSLLSIDGYSKSLTGLIQSFSKNIFRIANDICGRLK